MMNNNGGNNGSHGMMYSTGNMYVSTSENGASSFPEHFWPQPVMDASLGGLGQMHSQNHSHGRGHQSDGGFVVNGESGRSSGSGNGIGIINGNSSGNVSGNVSGNSSGNASGDNASRSVSRNGTPNLNRAANYYAFVNSSNRPINCPPQHGNQYSSKPFIHKPTQNHQSNQGQIQSQIQSQSQSRSQSQSQIHRQIQTVNKVDNTSDPSSPRTQHNLNYTGAIGHHSASYIKKRVAKACDHCRKRKIKCGEIDNNTKKCANCTKYCVECIFSNPRDDFDKKQRKSFDNLIRSNSQGSENIDPIKFGVPLDYNVDITNDLMTSSNTNEITRNDNETREDSIDSGKVEKLDRKVSVIIDKVAKLEDLFHTLLKSHENEAEKNYLNKSKPRHYYTTLLTIQKLLWFKRINCPHESYQLFLNPLREIMTISMKWYVAQMKITIDFSSPTFKNGYYSVNPIPSRAQSKRLIENFRAALLASSGPGFNSLKYYSDLVDKYYDLDWTSLSYSEMLLLNTSICSGASRMRQVNSNDFYHLRKDKYNPTRNELKKIENDTLLNAIFYYNKVVIGGGGVIEIQGLLLLSLYLHENINTDLALTVLSTAIRFALENEFNKVPPLNISFEEESMRRSLWWHCYNKDKKFALLLSKPPIIRYDDTNMLTDEQYYFFTKRILYTKFPEKEKDIDNLDDLDSALDYVVKFSEFVPFIMSYFVQNLGKIEAKIVDICFSFKTLVNLSFDQVVDKLIDIRKELLDWVSTLHPSMKLDSYKKYISLLYLPNDVEDPGLSYEIISSRVIVAHLRSLHLKNLLCMFATSFLLDNADKFRTTRHKILTLYTMFEEEGLKSCLDILKIFQFVEYDLHMYNDTLYIFLTAAFALILHVTKNINIPDKKIIPPIIELLIKDHELLVGPNQEHLVSDNNKWNTSIFFYSFLLGKVINSFNIKNPIAKDYNFKAETYELMLNKIQNYMELLKNDVLDGLERRMNNYPLGDDTPSKNGSAKPADIMQISPLSRCRFNSFDEGTMKNLRSKKTFELYNKDVKNWVNLSSESDKSLFPMKNSYVRSYDPFTSYSDVENLANDSATSAQEIFQDEATDNIDPLLEQFQDFFCQNELFFDRDLQIGKAFRNQIFKA